MYSIYSTYSLASFPPHIHTQTHTQPLIWRSSTSSIKLHQIMRFGSAAHLPSLSLFLLILHPAQCWRHMALSSRHCFKGRVSYHLFFISHSISANKRTNNQSCSLGSPCFLVPLLLLQLYAVCPYMAIELCNHRQFGLISVIVTGVINTLAPTGGFEVKAWLQSIHYQINNMVLSRQPGNHKTRGSSSFEKCRRSIWDFILMLNINNSAFYQNRASGSLMGIDRWGKMQEVTMSVAQSCQRDRLNGFRPLVNPFSNVLTFPQPPPSSVLLTMPGSSLDLHLLLCFLNRCVPLWFFLFFFFKAHN